MIRLFFERIKKGNNPFSYDRLHLHHLLLKKYIYLKTISLIIIFIYTNSCQSFRNSKMNIIIIV